MAYEVLPLNDAERAVQSAFESTIIEQIGTYGNQNAYHVDRYNPGQQPFDIWQSYSVSGQVEFADLWQVHRLDIDDKELTYAHLPRVIYKRDDVFRVLDQIAGKDVQEYDAESLDPKTEFYVTEFDDEGAIARTLFVEHEGVIRRQRVSNFIAAHGIGLVDLSKDVSGRKADQLIKVMENPEENIVALNGLMKLSVAEQRAVRKAHREYEERQRELRERIDMFERAGVIRPRTRY